MVTDIEQRLQRIAWNQLHHAYGDAGNIPDALLALLDPRKKVRFEALRHLRHSLNHQGFPESATPVAIPFLREILQRPDVHDRDALLNFFSELSLGHRMTALAHLEEMTLSGWRPEEPLITLYRDIYAEVCLGIPTYLELLDDPDEKVAHEALYLLAWLAPAAPALLRKLRRKRHDELSQRFRFGVSVALGLSLRFSRGKLKPSDLAYWQGELQVPSLLRRFGAAAGLVYANESPKPEILRVFHEALGSLKDEEIPWHHGHLGSYVGILLSWLRKTKEIDVVPMYIQVLEEKASTLSPRTMNHRQMHGMWPYRIAENLLDIAFETKPTAQWPSGYTPTQRWILRFLATHPNLAMQEGYCCLREYLNRLNLVHPGKPDETLRFETLEDITQLTGETYPKITKVLHRRIRILPGTRDNLFSFLELWDRACKANGEKRRKWLNEIVLGLSCSELCTFLEELLAQPEKTHRLPDSEEQTLAIFVSLLVEKPGMFVAVEKTAQTLANEGCLRYRLPSRSIFWTVAGLLLRLESQQASLAVKLLKNGREFFEHQETESIRDVLVLLPEKERGEIIDILHLRSFAEPDEAWSLYDLAPSAKRSRRLSRAIHEYADFFAGPGAARLVTLLSSFPREFLQVFVVELARPRATKRGYAHLLAAAFAQHEARAELLCGVTEHADPRVNWIVQKNRRLTKSELVQLEIDPNNKNYTRPKGGVIGANGKPWDGTMPRYRRK